MTIFEAESEAAAFNAQLLLDKDNAKVHVVNYRPTLYGVFSCVRTIRPTQTAVEFRSSRTLTVDYALDDLDAKTCTHSAGILTPLAVA